ncbi:MAG: tetratricopeptide repeat protein [Bacteroidales bacterium]|nr:tetratricopeptide repeat protein [Bacteroidales bacterium]
MKHFFAEILLLILMFAGIQLHAQQRDVDYLYSIILEYPEKFDFYFDYFELSNNLDKKEKLALQGIQLAHDARDMYNVKRFLLELANQCNNRGSHGKALVYYQKALSIAQSLGNNQKTVAEIFSQMGDIYLKWQDLQISEEYFHNAYKVYFTLNDSLNVSHCLYSLGKIKFIQNEFQQARDYYQQSLAYGENFEDYELNIQNLIGLGKLDYETSNYESALEYFDESVHLMRRVDNPYLEALIKLDKGKIHSRLNNFEKAMELIEGALLLSRNKFLDIEMNCYKSLSEINDGRHKDYLATKQFFLYATLRDSFYNSEEHSKIAEVRAQYEFLQKEKDLQKQNREIEISKKQEKISQLMMYFMLGGLILLIAIGVLLSHALRARYQKGKARIEENEKVHQSHKSLLRAEMMNTKLEKQRLKEELDNKNNELVQFARNRVQQGELVSNILDRLKKLKQVPDEEKTFAIRKMVTELDHILKNNQELSDFHQYIEEVTEAFSRKLNTIFPSLTPNEKKLAIFLRLGLSTKEVASLQHVSVKAIEMARYRLRKKLNLDNEDHLHEVFQTI